MDPTMINRVIQTVLAIATITIFSFAIVLPQNRTPAMDEPVAKFTDSVSGYSGVIRYSELITQLALQPGTPLDPPTTDDLNRALKNVINQRILAKPAIEEARAFGWMPSGGPDGDVELELKRILAYQKTPAEFEKRLKIAGFYSLQDERLRAVIRQRLFIDWYIDVHFRRPIRITPEIEERCYHEIFVPDFKLPIPGHVDANS